MRSISSFSIRGVNAFALVYFRTVDKHYHSNKRSYHEIRRVSDRLCKEHGLSVVVPGQDKGKSYIEHQAERNGTSYKAKLKATIDRLIPSCKDFEDYHPG